MNLTKLEQEIYVRVREDMSNAKVTIDTVDIIALTIARESARIYEHFDSITQTTLKIIGTLIEDVDKLKIENKGSAFRISFQNTQIDKLEARVKELESKQQVEDFRNMLTSL